MTCFPGSIQIRKDGHINASRIRNTDQTLGIFFNWSTELWKNVKLGYFRVVLQGSDKITEFTEYVDASASVSYLHWILQWLPTMLILAWHALSFIGA